MFGINVRLPFKKIKERQTEEVTQLFGDLGSVVCTTCQRSLQAEDSMIAGMGTICRERARFTERLDRKDLKSVEGKKEPVDTGLYPARNAIMRIKEVEDPHFVSIISVNPRESNMMDRTEMNKIYNETGSMAEAISRSIFSLNPNKVYSVASAVRPKHPFLAKMFNKFQRADRKDVRERIKRVRENLDDTYYQIIDSKKSLSDEQKEARDKLVVKVKGNDERRKVFQEGHYHMATLLSRLDDVFMPQAKSLKASIANVKELNDKKVKVKDYGLTDTEILRHFASTKSNERVIVKAFFQGSKDLPKMLELYNKAKTLSGMEKVMALKELKKYS